MWKPLEAKDDLPKPRTRERTDLDFKAEPTADSFENAKDIAAFANATGGTIIIGACGGDRLMKWKPLSDGDAKKCARDIDEAVKARCRPAPLFSTVEIRRRGGFIVAVNVWPFLGQPVGVRLLKDEAKRCEGAVFFPLRVGTQTIAITSEQLPMFVDAKLRRVVMILERAIGERVVLTPIKGPTNEHNVATLVAVDVLRNVARFGKGEGETAFAIPLDLIESVYHENLAWHLFMHGVVRDHKWMASAPKEMTSPKKFIPEF